jgi:hypothetical protein
MSMSCHHIFYDEDREKRDNVGSISKMNTVTLDWFRPSHGVIALCPVFVALCLKLSCPRQVVGCYFYSLENCLIDTARFPTLLQLP